MVIARGGDVIFEVQPPLYRLIAASPAMQGIEVIAEGAPVPAFDLFCPLLSLPQIFATDLSSIPGGVPYLTGDPALMPALPPRHKQRRWALVWAGNPRHPADRLRSLPATALDRLVITVDTAVAHLAGAMGKPTWLLLPHVADWRWMNARSDTPWYPSLGLYRQPGPGDWTSVIERIADEAAQGG
jgi:hypothetical protein